MKELYFWYKLSYKNFYYKLYVNNIALIKKARSEQFMKKYYYQRKYKKLKKNLYYQELLIEKKIKFKKVEILEINTSKKYNLYLGSSVDYLILNQKIKTEQNYFDFRASLFPCLKPNGKVLWY